MRLESYSPQFIESLNLVMFELILKVFTDVLHRGFIICSSYKVLHDEILKLKQINYHPKKTEKT